MAEKFSGRARDAQPALVNGDAAAVPGGQPRVLFGFTITRGEITAIEMAADPDRLCQLDLTILSD